jgi:aryl-alcohol dehydrogenase-like predicted oxidoreductase
VNLLTTPVSQEMIDLRFMSYPSWVLGSANWLSSYGVLGRSASSFGDVGELISTAEHLGCRAIDTAPSYLGSEDVIGRLGTSLQVHTKISPGVDPDRSLRESLSRLQRERVDVLYLHDPEAAVRNDGREIDAAAALLGDRVGAIGLSVYDIGQMRAGFARDDVGVVQIPINPLFCGLAHVAAIERRAGQTVVGRSVFAQGLLVTTPADLPQSVKHLAPSIASYQECCRGFGRSPVEVAVLWARDHPAINALIFGVVDVAQLIETTAILNAPPLSAEERRVVDELGRQTGDEFDPRMWR